MPVVSGEKIKSSRYITTSFRYLAFSTHIPPQYKISHAGDGQSGLTKAKDEFPDLIISDVMMPGMSGIELCRLIKNDIEISHIPFIMLTAKDALESKIEGVWSGADFLFCKAGKH